MSSKFIKFLESIFPFLFKALKRAWDQLTPDQQEAIVNAGLIGQFIKNNLTALGGDLVAAIVKETNLPAEVVSATLIQLAGKFGLTTAKIEEAVAFLQKKLSAAASDEDWNGLLQVIMSAGATILSGGSLDWAHMALGIAEWGYREYVEPKTAQTVSITSTPKAA